MIFLKDWGDEEKQSNVSEHAKTESEIPNDLKTSPNNKPSFVSVIQHKLLENIVTAILALLATMFSVVGYNKANEAMIKVQQNTNFTMDFNQKYLPIAEEINKLERLVNAMSEAPANRPPKMVMISP